MEVLSRNGDLMFFLLLLFIIKTSVKLHVAELILSFSQVLTIFFTNYLATILKYLGLFFVMIHTIYNLGA